MRASVSSSVAIPTLLLLASVAVAQDSTTVAVSVVTSPYVSPSPTVEQIYTIQTAAPSDPWACDQNCLMPPCPSSACSSGANTFTPVPLPRPRPESVASRISDSSLASVTGFMSIPAGETPIPSGASASATASPSSAGTRTASSSPSATPNTAALHAKADHIPLVAAVAGALALL